MESSACDRPVAVVDGRGAYGWCDISGAVHERSVFPSLRTVLLAPLFHEGT